VHDVVTAETFANGAASSVGILFSLDSHSNKNTSLSNNRRDSLSI